MDTYCYLIVDGGNVPGGIGTFEEFFEILTLKQLGRHKKPVVIYNVNGYYNPMLAMIDDAIEKDFMSEKCRGLYFVADTEAQVFDYMETYTPFQYNKYEFRDK